MLRARHLFVTLLPLFWVGTARADEAQETPSAPPPSEPPAVTADEPVVPHSPPGYNVPIAQQPSEHTAVDDSPSAHDGHPLAGYHNGLFYLRDHHDNFHLYIQGRLQLDAFGFVGPGVEHTELKPTLFIRRIRPEISGEFLGHWRFMIAGDFGATAIDNPRGTVPITAGQNGAAPRYASAETTRFQAAATDAFINYRAAPYFNVMVGQMDAPFMMENRTSDKFLPFMERSLAVRAVGVPTNKELGGMFWGETLDRLFYYSVGPYMGDGQNRPNVDSRFDLFTREFVHPLAKSGLAKNDPLRDAQVGASFRYGSRDQESVFYDYPSMTTQGAAAFWSPIYTSSKGMTHIIPQGTQFAVAGELRVPVSRFDVTGEMVYIQNNTREAVEGLEATTTDRRGQLHGVSYYAMVGFWLFGRRDINGVPGYGNPPRLDWSTTDPAPPETALQLLAKWEQVLLDYKSSSRTGLPDPKNIDGSITINAISFGVNYWATKHVRLTVDYVHDILPSSAPVELQGRSNRAQSPVNRLPPNVEDSARANAHSLNEILARAAIAL